MDVQHKLDAIRNQLNTVIVGKPAQTQDCVACLLAGGHLLIDDVPGVGKTTAVKDYSRKHSEVILVEVDHSFTSRDLFVELCGADPNQNWNGYERYATQLAQRKEVQAIVRCAGW